MAGFRLGGKATDVDMTKGGILGHILKFAFPLLLGNLFQQLYNTVDTFVVGNYVSSSAFSAVGAVTPIVNMLIGAFSGLASGAGVVISRYYGAGEPEKVSKAVHTAVVLTAILSVVFTVIGLALMPVMLNILGLNAQDRAEATTYLSIYFAGITGLLFYNMGAGILRAVGDSKRPFYYLVVCAVMNTVLDLVFVIVFSMGTAGVALATILSQGVSAVLVVSALLHTDSSVKVRPRQLRLHKDMLGQILILGIPAALQMAVTAFSNVFVQSYITHFDKGLPQSIYMPGWTAYIKVDQLIFLPVQSISLAVTTFVGQNIGAKQTKRANKGVTVALLLSIGCILVLMAPVLIFAPQIIGFLIPDPAVVETGTMFLRYLTPFYVLFAFNQIYACALRGRGNSVAPMIIMLSSFVGFRQIYLYVMSQICNEIIPIAMAYPAGWLLCSLLTGIVYHISTREKKEKA